MKRLLLSTTLMLALASSMASAQMPPASGAPMGGPMGNPDTVNCSGLRGIQAICLKNYSQSTITGVQTAATTAWTSNWMPLNIPPGGVQVIPVPGGWSGMVYMNVQTNAGTHIINHGRPFDIRAATYVPIGQGGWN